MPEKILFLGQIFEMEILMDLHVLRPPESKIHIFICVCVISITQKLIIAETLNLYFTFLSYINVT